MSGAVRWLLVAVIVFMVAVAPFVYFRDVYGYSKRLREVVPGRVYRSGQMTAEGFIDAFRRHHFKTFVNFQDDYPDPDLEESFWRPGTIKESELCRRLGVRYVFIGPDLVPRNHVTEQRPEAIDRLLALLDDEANYPVLLHCKAGLHRTGIMVAIYRMEYQGWTVAEAVREMKAHGYSEWYCTAANDYVNQYVLTYRRGIRRGTSVTHVPLSASSN
jgi:protein tyrosine phosphatase (PTP) superfamily phosphohydrolase (DUF442 family)